MMDANIIAIDAARAGPAVFLVSAPMKSAEEIVGRHFTSSVGGRSCRTLHFWRGDFYAHAGSHYREMPRKELRSRIYAIMSQGINHERKPFEPKRDIVADVLDAIEAVTYLDHRIEAPCFVDEGRDMPPGTEYIPLKNCLLHVPTRDRLDHTPEFFNLHALDFDYDPNAEDAKRWDEFLHQLWPDDTESRDALQEMFGLYLTPDTSHQKIGLIVGPRRSGKGTIARTLCSLIGQHNYDSPTLSSLSHNFGLSSMIGKLLAVIADARLSGKTDHAVIAERLLSISGEDFQTIDRKYKDPWTGKLFVRFLLLSNELPSLTDASGALASRFIILKLDRSFYGQEDHDLTFKLQAELPGILNWALDGLDRLKSRRRLVQPKSSLDAVADLEDLASPIAAFLRDCCEINPALETQVHDAFTAWGNWCSREGRDHPGTSATFGRNLKAAASGITTKQVRRHGDVVRVYAGMGLMPSTAQAVMDNSFDDANRGEPF